MWEYKGGGGLVFCERVRRGFRFYLSRVFMGESVFLGGWVGGSMSFG